MAAPRRMNSSEPIKTNHLTGQKSGSPFASEYPLEDLQGTDMFHPFFLRKRTWLVLTGLALLFIAFYWMSVDSRHQAEAGLDLHKVRLGLGIFVCIAFLWLTEALPLAATALLVPVLACLAGLANVKSALEDFANPLIYLFFGGFALASALAYQGLDRWIAVRAVRFGRGSYLAVSALLFGATAALSMWMSNTATAALMTPLAVGITAQLRGGPIANTCNTRFLLLGVAYAASIGGIGTVVGSPPNGIAAQQLGLSFQDWLRFGIPCVLLLLPLMFLVLYLVCRPDASRGIEIESQPFVFNWHRLVTLVIFGVTALAWVFSLQLGRWIGVESSLDTVIALLAVLALLYTRVVRWRDIERGTNWGVLLLFGGGIALSSVLKNSGTSLYVARVFSDAIQGWPMIAIIAAVIFFVIFLTELSSNTATAALLVPIFFAIAGEMNLAPARLVVPLAVAASCAFMLPVGTPPNAIVFGTGKVPQRSMMRVGLALNLVFVLALTLLGRYFF